MPVKLTDNKANLVFKSNLMPVFPYVVVPDDYGTGKDKDRNDCYLKKVWYYAVIMLYPGFKLVIELAAMTPWRTVDTELIPVITDKLFNVMFVKLYHLFISKDGKSGPLMHESLSL